jgi:hypothetical protein
LPSVALDDPTFVRPIPSNSWGGAAQALTALRAGRWLDHYGRSAEFAHLMQQWCEALQRDMTFRQQMDPLTGEFTHADQPNYSPAALVMYDHTWRLAGVREEGEELHWNVRPGHAASSGAVFRLESDGNQAEMRYHDQDAEISLGAHWLGKVEGIARIVTDKNGRPLYAQSIDPAPRRVELQLAGLPHRHLVLQPNARESLI